MNSFDIKIEGRGIWYVIHTLALHANTNPLKESYILTINTLADHFGCETCKPHFKKFIVDNPFKKYWHIKYNNEDLGFFKWSWELHNFVNKRLNKPILNFEDVLFNYKNMVCHDCHDNPILVQIKNETPTLNLVSYY